MSHHRYDLALQGQCSEIHHSLGTSVYASVEGCYSSCLPFQVTISISSGCSESISFHLSVINSSQMNTQFLELKCVENHGETAREIKVRIESIGAIFVKKTHEPCTVYPQGQSRIYRPISLSWVPKLYCFHHRLAKHTTRRRHRKKSGENSPQPGLAYWE